MNTDKKYWALMKLAQEVYRFRAALSASPVAAQLYEDEGFCNMSAALDEVLELYDSLRNFLSERP